MHVLCLNVPNDLWHFCSWNAVRKLEVIIIDVLCLNVPNALEHLSRNKVRKCGVKFCKSGKSSIILCQSMPNFLDHLYP
jgi:hypothetical protein